MVEEKINNIQSNNKKTLIYLIFLSIQIGVFFGIIGPIVPVIAEDLKIGFTYIGSALSISTFALLFSAIITGNLIEIFGIKRLLITGYFFLASGTVLFFFTKNYTLFLIANIFTQLAIGFLIVSVLSATINLFHGTKTFKIININIGITFGKIISPLLVALIIYFGFQWQKFFLFLLIPQIIFLSVVFFIKTLPKKIEVKNDLANLFKTNKEIIKNPTFILIFFISMFYGGVMSTFATWFTTYFISINVAVAKSSLFLSIYSISLGIGLILRNKIIKYIHIKKLLMVSILFSTIILVSVLLIYNILLKNILIFLYGLFITGNFSICLSMGTDIDLKYSNTSISFLYAAYYLGTVIFQFLSGLFVEYVSSNSVIYLDILLLVIIAILSIILNLRKSNMLKYKI